MQKVFQLSLMLMGLSFAVYGQHENNIWTFGHYAGLDFNNGTVTSITDSMLTESACASVASRSGDLLFYTNGETVWNRNHQAMPNGTGLTGNKDASVLQGALIIPFLNDTNKYYVFSMRDYNTSNEDDLYYSVVDLSLQNGMGDVVATQKNIWVDSGMNSALSAVPGDACNIWLITHLRDTNIFKVYEITEAGINLATPVVSITGSWSGEYAYRTSIMKVAPDRQQLALSNFTISTYSSHPELNVASSLELYDFNTSNGQVSNGQLIDETLVFFNNFLSLEFSPDGTKLYGGAPFMALMASPSVYQYDLSLPTLTGIQNSKTAVGSPALVGDIRRAPDGRIYIGASWSVPATSLDRIDDPNLAGAACNYMPSAIALQAGTHATTMFPTSVVYPLQDTIRRVRDTFICEQDVLSLPMPDGYLYYSFQGIPVTDTMLTINEPGTYWLTYENHCERIIDTIHVGVYELDAGLQDTALCRDAFELSIDVTANNPQGTVYTWQDGNSGPLYTVTQPGTYWVTMNKDGCIKTDSMTINGLPFPEVDLGIDTTICLGDVVQLKAPAADSLLWQDGGTGPDYMVNTAGEYTLLVYKDGCPGADTIKVSSIDCHCRVFVPNAFSPNGDGLNDHFTPQVDCGPLDESYRIKIFNRWGQQVFFSNDITRSWNGTYKGNAVETGTYFYFIEYEDYQGAKYTRKGDLLLLY